MQHGNAALRGAAPGSQVLDFSPFSGNRAVQFFEQPVKRLILPLQGLFFADRPVHFVPQNGRPLLNLGEHLPRRVALQEE